MSTDPVTAEPHGSVVGRDLRTGASLRVAWQRGVITELAASSAPGPENVWLAPSLVDLQVNGYAGVDFQSDGLGEEDVLRAVRGLRRDGCARFLLTLITDEWKCLMRRLAQLRQLRARSEELRHSILGWHVEGPFLSDQAGYHGAHDPAKMCDPTPELIQELKRVVGEDPCLLTLAPERSGAVEAITCAVSLGIRISLGHTNASAAALAAATTAGASGFTHLGNACPQALDRHDNILLRAMDQSGLRYGLIPDGIHVSPAFFRLAHRAVPDGQIYYTTDAMSAAGAPPGQYRLGTTWLEVGVDGVVRKPGASHFAGSALRPIDGVIRAAVMLSERWQKTWSRFSDHPAQWIGWESGLKVGNPAAFYLVEAEPTGQPRLARVIHPFV